MENINQHYSCTCEDESITNNCSGECDLCSYGNYLRNKGINFINTNVSKENIEAHSLLVHCTMCGFRYEQAAMLLTELGYYVPQDQFIAFREVLDIAMSLDVGPRQDELLPLKTGAEAEAAVEV